MVTVPWRNPVMRIHLVARAQVAGFTDGKHCMTVPASEPKMTFVFEFHPESGPLDTLGRRVAWWGTMHSPAEGIGSSATAHEAVILP